MARDKWEPSAAVDLSATDFFMQRPGDVLALVGDGVRAALLLDTQFDPDFFDLSTGFAGEVVQKCMNYGLRVGVALTGGATYSTSFAQFAAESTRQGRFVFGDSIEEARGRLK